MSAEGFAVGLGFFKGRCRENGSIRKTVPLGWWWIQGGGKGAEGSDAVSGVCGRRGGAARGCGGGFPAPQGWEKGWNVSFSCFLHGCSSWGGGVSAGGLFVTKCPPAELGKPLDPLPVEKLCFGVNPCVAAEHPCSRVWRANPPGAQGRAAQCVRVSWDCSYTLGNKQQCSARCGCCAWGAAWARGTEQTLGFGNAVGLSQCSCSKCWAPGLHCSGSAGAQILCWHLG